MVVYSVIMPERKLEIVNVTGFKGSGKTLACDYLQRTYGATLFNPIQLINFHNNGPVESPAEYDRAQREMLEAHPDSYVGPILQQSGRLCIDGLFVLRQIKQLQVAIGDDFHTLALQCHPAFRAQNLRKHPKSTYDLYVTQEQLEHDEALDRASDPIYRTEVQASMDHCLEGGWLVDTSHPITSTRRELDNIAQSLGWERTA